MYEKTAEVLEHLFPKSVLSLLDNEFSIFFPTPGLRTFWTLPYVLRISDPHLGGDHIVGLVKLLLHVSVYNTWRLELQGLRKGGSAWGHSGLGCQITCLQSLCWRDRSQRIMSNRARLSYIEFNSSLRALDSNPSNTLVRVEKQSYEHWLLLQRT